MGYHPLPPTYSYKTADDVVFNFLKKHARAAEIVANTYGYSLRAYSQKLKILFMKDNRRWNVHRDRLKYFSFHWDCDYWRRLTLDERKEYLTNVVRIADDYLLDCWESGKKP